MESMQKGEIIAYQGILGEVVHTTQPDGRVFERYRRAPGIRLILCTPDGKFIMTRERRQETGSIDLRLPGGKVCDSLDEYHSVLSSKIGIEKAARTAAVKDTREETGLKLHNLRSITKVPAGATVEWDLYYFISDKFVYLRTGQQLEAGEEIEVVSLSPAEVRKAIANNEMQEWRTVGVLLGMVFPMLEGQSKRNNVL